MMYFDSIFLLGRLRQHLKCNLGCCIGYGKLKKFAQNIEHFFPTLFLANFQLSSGAILGEFAKKVPKKKVWS